MNFETWLAFTFASAAVVLIPGPNIVLTINYALRMGRRSGIATVPGVVAGAFVAMTASLAGAGAVIAASATLFTLMKIAGAAYLLWLAYRLWTAPTQADDSPHTRAGSLGSIFWQSFLTSALNPKGPIFYMAFVPQFVSAGQPLLPQFAILIATFLVVAGLNGLLWLMGASSLRQALSAPRVMRAINRTGATCLTLAAAFTLRASRTA